MSFLPIASRELRVAARKSGTFWLRVAAALAALVIGGGCLLVNRLQGAGPAQIGRSLFFALTWMGLAAGLSAGLFFTSDSLSEEKREGTLGLLFLTELRGFDVVLGKLLATSLRGFYALLAVFPILGLTQWMGGITGDQYWKSSLALINALFVSLAAGLFVSAWSRESQKALGATLLLLLVLVFGGPLADSNIAAARKGGFRPFWSQSSPAYALVVADGGSRSPFWTVLAITQVMGWGLLGCACAVAPHFWQEKKRSRVGEARGWSHACKYGSTRQRQRRRRRLFPDQPLAWLAGRERWQSSVLWAMAILSGGGFVALLGSEMPKEAWLAWTYVGGLFTLILYLWAASQACRFFVEARRSGTLELVLATPVTEREIVAGQWRAMVGMFGLPLLVLLGVHIAGAALAELSFSRLANQISAATSSTTTNKVGSASVVVSVNGRVQATTSAGTNQSGPLLQPSNATTNMRQTPRGSSAVAVTPRMGLAFAAAAVALAGTVGNLLALGWFGMWMGMTSRSTHLATLKTLLFVQIIPWLVISFGTSMVAGVLMLGASVRGGSASSTAWLAWFPLLSATLSAGLALGKDAGFILWSRKRLYVSLREQAAHGVGPFQNPVNR